VLRLNFGAEKVNMKETRKGITFIVFVFPGTCRVFLLLILATLRLSRPRLSLIVTVLSNEW